MKLYTYNLISKCICIVVLLAFSIGYVDAQDTPFLVKGNVTDSKGEALVGVVVVVKGTNVGATTGLDGNFEINASIGQTLVYSLIGFGNKEIMLNSHNRASVVMEQEELILGEIVFYGYGSMQRKDLTGSIHTLSNKEITKAMTTNVTEALNGRVSGVVVSKDSNRPGADMSIQIRGQNSLNYSNQPLFVIDGVPSKSGLRTIHPDDIESIDVLKDASSCAIYGSQGANGVVIVTTKGANKTEGFTIEYSGNVGIKTATRIPDMLGNKGNGQEYLDFRIKQWSNKLGPNSITTPAFLTPEERLRVKNGEYYDWLREFAHDGLITNHTITASGGNKNTSYSFGMGYMEDEGLAGSEKFSRITSNVGIEQRAGEFLRMGMKIYVSYNDINHGSPDALYNAYLIPPIIGRYNLDGTPIFTHRPGGRVNPLIQDENVKNKSEGWAVNSVAFVEYKPIKSLALKTQLAMQYDGAMNGIWTGSDTQSGQGVKLPDASRSEGKNQNWIWDNTITYDKKFGDDHKLNLVGLFSIQKDTHKTSGMVGEGLPYESGWHAIQTANQILNVNSNYWEHRLVSFMGRANYVFKERYMLTVTARYDGSSRLAKGNRWGLMPSAALGWHIKNENFMKNVNWLSALKLRVSWGKTGNNVIAHDATFTNLAMSTYYLGDNGEKGFGIGKILGNKHLKWEMTSEWNCGLDFGFLKGRISGSLDLYTRKTVDLISQRQIAKINGFTTVLENIGSVGNKGVELTLNTHNISKKDLSWTTNLTFSLNRNKILDLDGTKTDDLANRRFIGHPINVIYDVEQAGIWQLDEKDEAGKYGHSPGWIKIHDLDNNGSIDANDMRILGSPLPDWTAGMTNTVTYRDWDLSIFMYARVGGLYSDPFTYFFTGINNQDWNKLDVPYWTSENGGNKYPGIGLETLWTQVLSQQKGSFLKIQNITLGYTFNPAILKKAKIKSLRVYTTVQNPFTFTSYMGSDPEIIGENLTTQLSLYPMSFIFGLNIKF